MEFDPIPALVDDEDAQDVADRAWVSNVTESIGVELQRASLSKTTWRERTLIWKGRSLAYAEKARQSGGKLVRPTYAESVLGACRVRAGWEFLAQKEPALTEQLVDDCETHFLELEERDISPIDVDTRPDQLTIKESLMISASWLWSAVWMLGLITWRQCSETSFLIEQIMLPFAS